MENQQLDFKVQILNNCLAQIIPKKEKQFEMNDQIQYVIQNMVVIESQNLIIFRKKNEEASDIFRCIQSLDEQKINLELYDICVTRKDDDLLLKLKYNKFARIVTVLGSHQNIVIINEMVLIYTQNEMQLYDPNFFFQYKKQTIKRLHKSETILNFCGYRIDPNELRLQFFTKIDKNCYIIEVQVRKGTPINVFKRKEIKNLLLEIRADAIKQELIEYLQTDQYNAIFFHKISCLCIFNNIGYQLIYLPSLKKADSKIEFCYYLNHFIIKEMQNQQCIQLYLVGLGIQQQNFKQVCERIRVQQCILEENNDDLNKKQFKHYWGIDLMKQINVQNLSKFSQKFLLETICQRLESGLNDIALRGMFLKKSILTALDRFPKCLKYIVQVMELFEIHCGFIQKTLLKEIWISLPAYAIHSIDNTVQQDEPLDFIKDIKLSAYYAFILNLANSLQKYEFIRNGLIFDQRIQISSNHKNLILIYIENKIQIQES